MSNWSLAKSALIRAKFKVLGVAAAYQAPENIGINYLPSALVTEPVYTEANILAIINHFAEEVPSVPDGAEITIRIDLMKPLADSQFGVHAEQGGFVTINNIVYELTAIYPEYADLDYETKWYAREVG